MNPVELAPTQRPLLGSSEKIMCIQNKVGLYQGLERDEEHDCGTVYLTTQRLVYVDQQLPHERSLALNLQAIHRCTLHGGFLYTSAKICLYLKPKPTNGSDRDAQPAEGSGTSGYSRQNGAQGTTLLETTGTANMYGQARPGSSAGPIGWKCNICDQINRGSIKCTLCGVPHQGNYEFTDTCNVAADTRPVNASGAKRQPLRCPVCTFDNHESMVRCEMCDTGLSNPDEAAADQTNADPSKSTEYQRLRTQEQANSGRDSNGTISLIKLSFRAGGASAFYATLKGAVDNSPCKLIGIDSFGEHTVPPAPLQGQQQS
ncbi:Vacuolar protein-sorting-associated protein 36, partial [Kickxella alabastrina]